MELKPVDTLQGEITVPGDKSISHRAVMFGALSSGITEVRNFLQGADCLSTIDCFSRMGIEIENRPDVIRIHGKGLHGLKAPQQMLDTGNSGTTTRLISGILSGQPFTTVLNGDESIQTRPMKRIMTPLRQMGADIISLRGNDCAPLQISPGTLHGMTYVSPVASAQVKSCILLAGLYADAPVSVIEPVLSRNHSELMLRSFGATVRSEGTKATIEPEPTLIGQQVNVPGDISSAAYFIGAGLLAKKGEVLVKNVGINPTRDGFLRVCKDMGARITLLNIRESSGEPVADILVQPSKLHGTTVEGEIIPTLIDEIPMIAVMAAFAEGTTVIKDAAELKVKETDRIETVTAGLRAMGVSVTPTEDGMIIEGGNPVHGGIIDSRKDHRIAMSFAIGALSAESPTTILDGECVNISYPSFYEDLHTLF